MKDDADCRDEFRFVGENEKSLHYIPAFPKNKGVKIKNTKKKG